MDIPPPPPMNFPPPPPGMNVQPLDVPPPPVNFPPPPMDLPPPMSFPPPPPGMTPPDLNAIPLPPPSDPTLETAGIAPPPPPMAPNIKSTNYSSNASFDSPPPLPAREDPPEFAPPPLPARDDAPSFPPPPLPARDEQPPFTQTVPSVSNNKPYGAETNNPTNANFRGTFSFPTPQETEPPKTGTISEKNSSQTVKKIASALVLPPPGHAPTLRKSGSTISQSKLTIPLPPPPTPGANDQKAVGSEALPPPPSNSSKQTIKIAGLNISNTPNAHEQFKILERLGKGSFGAVYKAQHEPTGTIVALKKCLVENYEDSLQEIQIMRECDNPHIVKFYGSYIFDESLWIVMEFCALGALNDILRLSGRLCLSERETAAIVKNVLAALEYLHAHSKMHRDIKPDNILLTSEGEPKLEADFGVAGKVSTLDKRSTLTGTPYYIAPEILKEETSGYGARADIWSLGVCTIELIQGQPPYYETPPMKVMLMIANNPPPTLLHAEQHSPEVNDFIASCLVKDPNKRPYAKDLLKHKFISSVDSCRIELRGLVQETTKAIEASGGIEAALRKERTRSGTETGSVLIPASGRTELFESANDPRRQEELNRLQQHLQKIAPPTSAAVQQQPGAPGSPNAVRQLPQRDLSDNKTRSQSVIPPSTNNKPIVTDQSKLRSMSASPNNNNNTPSKRDKKEKEKKHKKEKKEPKKLKESGEKQGIIKMLARFVLSRPSKEELVRRKILNSIYEAE